MANTPAPADFSLAVQDFPAIEPYLPIYGKFDLTTYIQGASDYEIMSYLVQCYNNMVDGYNKVAELSKDNASAISALQKADKDINTRIDDALKQIETLIDNDTIVQLVKQAIDSCIKTVFFGLNDDGYFVAYIPSSWDCITFGTIMDCDSENFGRLTLEY